MIAGLNLIVFVSYMLFPALDIIALFFIHLHPYFTRMMVMKSPFEGGLFEAL